MTRSLGMVLALALFACTQPATKDVASSSIATSTAPTTTGSSSTNISPNLSISTSVIPPSSPSPTPASPVASSTPVAKSTPTPNVSTVSTSKSPQTSPTPTLSAPTGTKPSALPISIQATVTGGTEAQRARLLKIAKNVELLMNSEAWKKSLLSNMWKGKPGFFGSTDTPEQVYKKMVDADEYQLGKPDHIWQYPAVFKDLGPSVYGQIYYRARSPIEINSRVFDGRADSGIAGTFAHEQSHRVGYDHASTYTATRPFSVPYVIGTVTALEYQKRFGK